MIYGLITDENIEKYCEDRNIPCFRKDPIERVINGERTNKSAFGNNGLIDKHTLIDIVRQGKQELGTNDNETNTFVVGSGCYHHITYGILQNQEIDYEFDIISLDHHSDLSYSIGGGESIVKCGDHNFASLRDIPNLRKVNVISYKDGKFILTHSDDYKTEEKREQFDEDELKNVLKQSPKTYLTIDIDVMNYPCGIKGYETYPQGNMPANVFLGLLEWVLENQNIIGMDICGLTPDERSFKIYDRILEKAKALL